MQVKERRRGTRERESILCSGLLIIFIIISLLFIGSFGQSVDGWMGGSVELRDRRIVVE